MENSKQAKKTESVIRLSWSEKRNSKVFYFRRGDAGELFDVLIRLKRKRLDFCIKVKREDLSDVL